MGFFVVREGWAEEGRKERAERCEGAWLFRLKGQSLARFSSIEGRGGGGRERVRVDGGIEWAKKESGRMGRKQERESRGGRKSSRKQN